MRNKLLLSGILVGTLAGTLAVAGDKPISGEVQVQASEMTFAAIFGPGGPEQAMLHEDAEGAAVVLRLPAGYESSWHTHDREYHGVVLKGTVAEPVQGGGEPRLLTPGAYYYQPGKQNHITRCASKDSECLIFIYRPGKFSFTPTTPDGKPLPPPPAGKAAPAPAKKK